MIRSQNFNLIKCDSQTGCCKIQNANFAGKQENSSETNFMDGPKSQDEFLRQQPEYPKHSNVFKFCNKNFKKSYLFIEMMNKKSLC